MRGLFRSSLVRRLDRVDGTSVQTDVRQFAVAQLVEDFPCGPAILPRGQGGITCVYKPDEACRSGCILRCRSVVNSHFANPFEFEIFVRWAADRSETGRRQAPLLHTPYAQIAYRRRGSYRTENKRLFLPQLRQMIPLIFCKGARTNN